MKQAHSVEAQASFLQALTLLLALMMLFPVLSGPGTAFAEAAASPSPAVADASQMTTVEDVTEEGMTPIFVDRLLDGDYPGEVNSSSSMFRIESAVLHVHDGVMTATLRMSGKSYLYVFPGSAWDAATGEAEAWIPFTEDADGTHTFTVPVEALDAGLPFAAFSKNKELWYDRTLLFRAASLPLDAFREGFFTTAESLGLEDGLYRVPVRLSGGSGKASVESPALLTVSDGSCMVEIVWGSRNYDYMKVNGEQILPFHTEGNSAFRIPVLFFDRPMTVIADTVAMSEPHEITYSLTFDSEGLADAEAEKSAA